MSWLSSADNCVTTDSEGLAEISFPRDGQEIACTIVHEGYGRWVFSNVNDERFPELFGSPIRFPTPGKRAWWRSGDGRLNEG